MPWVGIVRCVPCLKLRGVLVPVSECMRCVPAPTVAGRGLFCNYVFVPVGEEYGKEAAA